MNLKQKLKDALEDVEIDVTDLASYKISGGASAGRQFAGPSESELDEDEDTNKYTNEALKILEEME